MSELLMIEPRLDFPHVQPWVLDEHGHHIPGHNHTRRILEMKAGLTRHSRVSTQQADASTEEVERILGKLHEPDYLHALTQVRSTEPVLMAEFTAPGMVPDTPLYVGVGTFAYEGVRTAITAAQRIAAGAGGTKFAYALCAPPGHHAGPGWFGGSCYLNNAAAVTQILRDAGLTPVGILDLDIHYPNGTSAIVANMIDTSLHSLHAWPVVNSPSGSARPSTVRERLTEFSDAPTDAEYLDALAGSIDALARSAAVLVLSLGYDTVQGDPHGCWSFSSRIFTEIGRLLSASQLPICVVQEGGYALDSLTECSHAFAIGLLGADRA